MNKEDKIKKEEIEGKIRSSQLKMQRNKDLGLATDECRQSFITEQRSLLKELKPYMNFQDKIKFNLVERFLDAFENDLKKPVKERQYAKTEGGLPKEAVK